MLNMMAVLKSAWIFLPAIAMVVVGAWMALGSGGLGPRPWPLVKRIVFNAPRAVGMTAVWAVALLALQHLIGLDLSSLKLLTQ